MDNVVAFDLAQAWNDAANNERRTAVGPNRTIVFADDNKPATSEYFAARHARVAGAQAGVKARGAELLKDQFLPHEPQAVADLIFAQAYSEVEARNGEYDTAGPDDWEFWASLSLAYQGLVAFLKAVEEARA